jgi:hypothetical protein
MKNIALTSGILYSPKQAGLNAEVTKPDTSFTINYKVNLQYIQIPVGFKFFTNPVTDKIKIYAELSGMLDLKINEKPVVRNEYFTRTFAALWDAGINVGAGIEWQINDNNKLVAGLLWNRGFNNIIQKDFIKEHGITKRNLEFRNDLVNLVLAFKF